MKISKELANEIVAKNMEILGKNINIMNEKGIIIASGQTKRINTYHKIAHEVVENCQTIEVDEETSINIPGVLPGINMPIENDGKVIGVVGITGDPKNVRDYGALIKNTVELMLRQAFLQDLLQREKRVKESIFYDLLLGFPNDSDIETLKRKLRLFKITLDMPMAVFVVNITEAELNIGNKRSEEKHFRDKLKEYTLDFVDNRLFQNYYAVPIGSEQIVFFKTIPSHISEKHLKTFIFDAADKIQKMVFKNTKRKTHIGIGKIANNILSLKKSYKTANQALKIGKKLYSAQDIYFWEEIISGLLIEQASSEVQELLTRFNESRIFKNESTAKTLKIFLESSFNLNQAASKLFIHRNTLKYRLQRIKDDTGLDPFCFKDAVTLYLILLNKEFRG